MKIFIEKCKKYNEIINMAVISFLLFMSCFFEAFAYITVVYCVIVSIFYNFEKVMKILLFTFPFQVVFKSGHFKYLYLLMVFLFTCVLGIKYIIELVKKKKRLNFKLLIPIAVFLVYLLLPFHKVTIVNYVRYILIYALVYLTFEYRKEISLANLVRAFWLGLMLSCVFYLTQYCSSRMEHSVAKVLALGEYKYIRFAGLFNHPNDLASNSIILLSFLIIAGFKEKIKFWELILYTLSTFLVAYLSISKGLIIAFVLLIAIFVILFFIKFKRKAFKYVLPLVLGPVLIAGVCYYPTKLYVLRLDSGYQVEYETKVETDEDGANNGKNFEYLSDEWWDAVYKGELHYDPGRAGIFKMYLKDWSSSAKTIMFGRGISAAPVGKMTAHNYFIQILWYHGLIGCLLYAGIIFGFINIKKLFKNLDKALLLLLPIILIFCTESPMMIQEYVIYLLVVVMCNKEEQNTKNDVMLNETNGSEK